MKNLIVHYAPEMVADAQSFSPSAGKPSQVVQSWHQEGLPVIVQRPVPVTREQLKLAHCPRYVDDVLDGRQINGFGNHSLEVAESLLWTSGSMLSAARDAIARQTTTCAPCSGFHHAGWDSGGGFCTFNGLMVTAQVLLTEGIARKVGILDCDMHYGDGTVEILNKLRKGASQVLHWTAGREFRRPKQVEAFMKWLQLILVPLSSCDVVLYQAGADPHINDPLGGWLTTSQLKKRDALVLRTLHQAGVPTAWNLAGGYQKEQDGSIPKVLQIHLNTAKEWVALQESSIVQSRVA